METKTIDQEVQELTQHEIPFGQKLVLAGFKQVSVEQLENRFGLPAIRAKLPNKEDEAVSEWFKEKKIKPEDFEINEAQHLKSIGILWIRGVKTVRTRKMFVGFKINKEDVFEKIEFDYGDTNIVAKVAMDPFSKYIGDVIPDRIYSAIARAESLGLSRDNMLVAYPCIGTEKRPDPVLVYPYPTDADPKGMLEIGYWE